jgi:hypothetical protein
MKAVLLAVGITLGTAAACRAPASPLSAGNAAAELTVEGVAAQSVYGDAAAPAGRQFLVLATQWENRIDPKLAENRGLAPGYGVEGLDQHLFLVINGGTLGVLRPGLDDGTGRKSLGSVVLPTAGTKVVGDLVFEIPAGAFTSADLRFYDDTAGDMSLALAGPAPAQKPLRPPQKNAVGEFAVFGFDDPPPGAAAPAGFRAVAVDLRARSVWRSEKEAPAYDPAAPPGTMVERINLLDWMEARKYLQVLADGEYACPPAEGGALPDAPRFIPEFFTGWRVTFFVPGDAKSLDLICEMPHAATDSDTLNLPPLRFALSGKPPANTGPDGPLKIRDEMFEVAVAARRAAAFAGEAAGDGRQFVILDVGVTNQGDTGQFFQPKDQLFVVSADGSEQAIDDATVRGSHRPEETVHLPPHEHRRFEVGFRLDAAVAKPQLSFHGGEFMKTFDLQLPP